MNKEQNRLIQAKEKEIEGLKKFYNTKKDMLVGDNEAELIKLRTKNLEKVDTAQEKYSQKLEKYKTDSKELKDRLEAEKQQLTQVQRSQLNHAYEAMKQESELKKLDAHKHFIETDAKTQWEIEKFNADSKRDVLRSKLQAKALLDDNVRRQKFELKKMENAHRLKSSGHLDNFREKVRAEEKEHRDTLVDLKRKNIIETQQLRRINQDQIDKAKRQYDEKLTEKQRVMDRNLYIEQRKHDRTMARVKAKLSRELQNVIAFYSQEKESYINKKDDSFYRVAKLEPTLKDRGDHYLVEVSIPKYEKENIHLSARDRRVKVTLARRFEETLPQGDNVSHKVKRTELMEKELHTADILDPLGVTQKFENGVLSFKVAKL